MKNESRLKLSYLYGGTALYEPGEVLGPRLLTDYEAIMVIEGEPIHETQFGQQQLSPGAIVLTQPGSRETYHWDTKARTRHAYFHFDIESVPAAWPAPGTWPHLLRQPPAILGELFRHIIERITRHSDWPAHPPEAADNHVFETFLELYLDPAFASEDPAYGELSEPVHHAVKAMRERLDHPHFVPFALEELAEIAHVSQKHLCRIFRKELGVSPVRACRLMQFQLAIPLLARSNLNIKQIALRCGFPDQFYFSRNFTTAFGESPSHIRKKLQSGQLPPPNPLPPALMPRLYW